MDYQNRGRGPGGHKGGKKFGDRDSNRTMYQAVCVSCGARTEVPFEPREGQPIYCRECFQKVKGRERPGRGEPRRPGEKPMYQAVCASCGARTEVPFEPKPGKPVYCKECFAREKGRETILVSRDIEPSLKQEFRALNVKLDAVLKALTAAAPEIAATKAPIKKAAVKKVAKKKPAAKKK